MLEEQMKQIQKWFEIQHDETYKLTQETILLQQSVSLLATQIQLMATILTKK